MKTVLFEKLCLEYEDQRDVFGEKSHMKKQGGNNPSFLKQRSKQRFSLKAVIQIKKALRIFPKGSL